MTEIQTEKKQPKKRTEYNMYVSLGNCSWTALDGMAELEKWLLSALCKYQTNYSFSILKAFFPWFVMPKQSN